MGETINQYELLEPFQSKNAGFSKWTYAVRRGKNYFLKEFLDPVYPSEDSLSETLRKRRLLDCEEFEARQKRLYKSINDGSDGNLVRIFEFFRYDNHYYISTERIVKDTTSIGNLINEPIEKTLFLCKRFAHSIRGLHREHIVHADIKEDNILIKQTKMGRLIGKVIDFDAGFFEWDPPVYEDDLGGDQIYLAPESCQFICGDPVKLTTKIDVFALGILFHQYMTGELPAFDREEYDYAFDSVLDGNTLGISEKLPEAVRTVLARMLVSDPEERLSMEEVYAAFDAMDEHGNLAASELEELLTRKEPEKTEQEPLENPDTGEKPILVEELADANPESLGTLMNRLKQGENPEEEPSTGVPEDIEEDRSKDTTDRRLDMPLETDENDPLSGIRAKYFFNAGDL